MQPASSTISQPASQGSLSGWLFAALVGVVLGLVVFLALRWAQKGKSANLSSAQLGLLAVLIGAILGLFGALLSSHDHILDLIVAAITAILVIQVGETLRAERLSRRMQSLERALDHEDTYLRISENLTALEKLVELQHKYPKAAPLFTEFLVNAANSYQDTLNALGEGTIEVRSTARELTFNKDCLLHLASHEVWAISYQDGTFWDDPEGRDFLELHDEKIAAGVRIHRVFLLTRDELEQQTPIIEDQIARKIDCRILLLDSPSNADVVPEDFVLYDDTFVRSATRVNDGPTTTLKSAALSCNQRKVRDYIEKRNNFKTRSEPAAELFRKMPSKHVGK